MYFIYKINIPKNTVSTYQMQQKYFANYAIKTAYLKNLIESTINDLNVLPDKNNSLIDKNLSEQVKQTKRFVYAIKCQR